MTRLGPPFWPQSQILAVWILAAKLLNSDLNFAVDFWVDFLLLFFPRKKAQNNPPKIPRKIHPGLCSEKFPSDFCRSLFLTFWPQKSPQKSSCGSLFCIPSQQTRHIIFSGGPKCGVLGGGQKVYVEKVYHTFQNHYTHEIVSLNCLEDYGYSFQEASELIALQLQFPCFSCRMQLQEIISPQEFSRIFSNYSYMI